MIPFLSVCRPSRIFLAHCLRRMYCSSSTMDISAADESEAASDNREQSFTSEIFKIKICNLPSYIGHGQIKKLLGKRLELNPVKVKAQLKQNVAYATFRSEEEKQKAMTKINGFVWKKHELTTKTATASKDPIRDKRDSDAKRIKIDDEDVDIGKVLNDHVTPLWQTSYEEQLELKRDAHANVLKKLVSELDIEKLNWEINEDGLPCILEKARESPIRTHYRNKCEFSLGTGQDGLTTVGFRLGSYRDGDLRVVTPRGCYHVPPLAVEAAERFQGYVRQSKLGPFDPVTHSGHWRMLTVRTTMTKDVMMIAYFHPQDLSQGDVDEEVAKLKAFFAGTIATSVLVQLDKSVSMGNTASQPYQLIHGEPIIHETLLGLKFRISPEAFFQINTPAAEVLYRVISDYCAPTPDTHLLDICCGTGTIGLTLAKNVARVTGIEMIANAIDDARANADANDIHNVEFVTGKAEDVLPELLPRIGGDGGRVVGVVDPPRAGLHGRVVQAMRKCKELNRIVYVSCNPNAAYKNFLDLCRPESGRLKGRPFRLVKATPVDLFPMTRHCELVLLFERR